MEINRIKNYKKGVRASRSVVENFKDLMLLMSHQEVNLTAEAKRLEEKNKAIGMAGNLLYHVVSKIVRDEKVVDVVLYLTDFEYENVQNMINDYRHVVDIQVKKSNSIKGGYDLVIRRIKDVKVQDPTVVLSGNSSSSIK